MADLFKTGKKATVLAGLGTAFFALAKGVVGIFSGSVVLVADAVHSAADAASTFFAWFGLKIAQAYSEGRLLELPGLKLEI